MERSIYVKKTFLGNQYGTFPEPKIVSWEIQDNIKCPLLHL